MIQRWRNLQLTSWKCQNVKKCFYLTLGLFFFIFYFQGSQMIWILLLTGFQQQTTGVGSDHSTNWATTTTPPPKIPIDAFQKSKMKLDLIDLKIKINLESKVVEKIFKRFKFTLMPLLLIFDTSNFDKSNRKKKIGYSLFLANWKTCKRSLQLNVISLNQQSLPHSLFSNAESTVCAVNMSSFKWANNCFFLFIFVLFKHKFYRKNCRLQLDSKSDCRSRRPTCWPLDHHQCPSVEFLLPSSLTLKC